MSDDSLFSKHMRLIEKDESAWTEADREEFARLKALRLPPLELKPSFWARWKMQLQAGAGALALATIALVVVNAPRDETLTAKGSVQVSVIWERAGKVSPLTDQTELQDGDKIGASVISSEEAVAYWTITDNKMKVLGTLGDIQESELSLMPGVSKSFPVSFELTAPNQGENLLVAVCPKSKEAPEKKAIDSLFNRDFVTQLLSERKIRASDCIFVGYRLRRLP